MIKIKYEGNIEETLEDKDYDKWEINDGYMEFTKEDNDGDEQTAALIFTDKVLSLTWS